MKSCGKEQLLLKPFSPFEGIKSRIYWSPRQGRIVAIVGWNGKEADMNARKETMLLTRKTDTEARAKQSAKKKNSVK